MTTYTHKVKTPLGAELRIDVPTNAVAGANVTDGEDSPYPSEYVDEELISFRHYLAKHKIMTKVISIRATPHCVVKYIVLDRDNIEDRSRAKYLTKEFSIYADYLYSI